MEVVTITENPLRIEELLDVVRGASVRIAPVMLSRIRNSRAVVERALETAGPSTA